MLPEVGEAPAIEEVGMSGCQEVRARRHSFVPPCPTSRPPDVPTPRSHQCAPSRICPMNTAASSAKMYACRNATKISSIMIATAISSGAVPST
jgi:hypothetical protein